MTFTKTIAVIVGVLILIAGAAFGFLALTDDADEPMSAEMKQTVRQANEVDATVLASNYLEDYIIDDTGFGTNVEVTIDQTAGTRTIKRNALPNHETGEFPNDGNPNTISEQDFTETYPLNPVFTGEPQFARTIGIAINGVKLEPDTAERATCDGSVVHSIEAIQDLLNLGLDFNNAHVQPTGEYHYHGASELLVDLYSGEDDLVHVAFAADGHNIYYSMSNAYSPGYRIGTDPREGTNCSYTPGGPNGGETINFSSTKDGSLKSDWEFDASFGQLDECNGIEINGEYIYLITDSYPYIGRCLMGEFSEDTPTGAAPGSQQQGPPQGQSGLPPR